MRQKLCYPTKYQYLQHLVDFTKYYYNISKNSIRNSGNILAHRLHTYPDSEVH